MDEVFCGFVKHVYGQIGRTLDGITETELSWRPYPIANTAGKILCHMARISYVLLPQVAEGTTQGEWNDSYEEMEHTLPEMLNDLEVGRVRVLRDLEELNDTDWKSLIPLWGGVYPRSEGLYMLVGEMAHHEGQVAYIRGAYRRAQAKIEK